MGFVFIYYPREDQLFVDRLVTDLRQAGVDARRALGVILPGKDGSPEIKKLMDEADAALYVLDDYMIPVQRRVFLRSTPVIFCSNRRLHAIPRIVSTPAGVKEQPVIHFHDNYDLAFQSLVSELPESVCRDHSLEPEQRMSMGYVFISYASEDTDFVVRLRSFFKGKGYGYWDYQESDRDYQQPLSVELEDIIRGAAATICILSPAWKRSTWARDEYDFVNEIGDPVFSLLVRPIEPTFRVTNKLYIDFTGSEEQAFEELDRKLRDIGLIE